MESADTTVECLEMATVRVGNHTHAAGDIHWFLSQIHCLCQWQFMDYFPMILNSLQRFVACYMGHPDDPSPLFSVEIRP